MDYRPWGHEGHRELDTAEQLTFQADKGGEGEKQERRREDSIVCLRNSKCPLSA